MVVALFSIFVLLAIAYTGTQKLNHETWNINDYTSIFKEKLSW